jgi:hypothetical protein
MDNTVIEPHRSSTRYLRSKTMVPWTPISLAKRALTSWLSVREP